ncbi:MAG: lytic polysaccharide monooxygenase [Deltaproteobacteria bacterium]|nr:lytic polysaccharide monooxygenase [Deltaproteobacteria bacterium]
MRALPLVVVVVAIPAFAHIELESPAVRYSNTPSEQNKSCPCGAGNGDERCGSGPTSDPNRNDAAVTTFTAGETITVSWLETVGHSGRFRVAFDAAGADLEDFNANILADIADPAGSTGNLAGNLWAVDVTLPSEPCDNCTLQLVQVMSGNTADTVDDPTGVATYFQCADLVLLAEGEGEPAEGEGEGEGEGEDDPPPERSGCGAVDANAKAALPWLLAPLLWRRRRSA